MIAQNVNSMLHRKNIIFSTFFLHPCWVEDPIPYKMWGTLACAKALPAINLMHHCTFSQLFLEWQPSLFFPPSVLHPFFLSVSFLFSHFHSHKVLDLWGEMYDGEWERGIGRTEGGRGIQFLILNLSFAFILNCTMSSILRNWSKDYSCTANLFPALQGCQIWHAAFGSSDMGILQWILLWPGRLWQGFCLVTKEREKEGLMVKEEMYGEEEGRRGSGK